MRWAHELLPEPFAPIVCVAPILPAELTGHDATVAPFLGMHSAHPGMTCAATPGTHVNAVPSLVRLTDQGKAN